MKVRMFLFSGVLSLAALPAFAGGTWTNVTVSTMIPYPGGGYLEVQLSANSTGSPSCASANKNYVVVDLSTASGAFAGAVLQSARLSGSTVSITGTGACTNNGAIENLSYVDE